jgi:hypothetical protein
MLWTLNLNVRQIMLKLWYLHTIGNMYLRKFEKWKSHLRSNEFQKI